jgi:hypothetical protein
MMYREVLKQIKILKVKFDCWFDFFNTKTVMTNFVVEPIGVIDKDIPENIDEIEEDKEDLKQYGTTVIL